MTSTGQERDELNQLVDHLFRHEAGKLVSTLTRMFGPSHLELAEDIVQDTLITAIDHWSQISIPENPAAWITQVAKRKALNALKKQQTVLKHIEKEHFQNPNEWVEEVFLEQEIKDSQLRMIFTCCHPQLNLSSQITLTLKTLCGFGVSEVARALLTNERTINKRLYRAKQKLRTGEIHYSIPSGEALSPRLDAVAITLYLLFNEGYNSSHPQSLIRKDLCLEALRLVQLLSERFTKRYDLLALKALMCFHIARFDARLDQSGAIILFEDQDRSLWNRELIAHGIHYLVQSRKGDQLTKYHLEAGIAAEHCLAQDFQSTDWKNISQQYELLNHLDPSPIIRLNLAIVRSQLNGVKAAIEELLELEETGKLANYPMFSATLGALYLRSGDLTQARNYLLKARQMTTSSVETEYFDSQLRKFR